MNTYSEDKMYESYSNEVERMQKCIDELIQENEKLKDNWNKLKQKIIDNFNKTQDVQFLEVLQDMQELRQGSDEQ